MNSELEKWIERQRIAYFSEPPSIPAQEEKPVKPRPVSLAANSLSESQVDQISKPGSQGWGDYHNVLAENMTFSAAPFGICSGSAVAENPHTVEARLLDPQTEAKLSSQYEAKPSGHNGHDHREQHRSLSPLKKSKLDRWMKCQGQAFSSEFSSRTEKPKPVGMAKLAGEDKSSKPGPMTLGGATETKNRDARSQMNSKLKKWTKHQSNAYLLESSSCAEDSKSLAAGNQPPEPQAAHFLKPGSEGTTETKKSCAEVGSQMNLKLEKWTKCQSNAYSLESLSGRQEETRAPGNRGLGANSELERWVKCQSKAFPTSSETENHRPTASAEPTQEEKQSKSRSGAAVNLPLKSQADHLSTSDSEEAIESKRKHRNLGQPANSKLERWIKCQSRVYSEESLSGVETALAESAQEEKPVKPGPITTGAEAKLPPESQADHLSGPGPERNLRPLAKSEMERWIKHQSHTFLSESSKEMESFFPEPARGEKLFETSRTQVVEGLSGNASEESPLPKSKRSCDSLCVTANPKQERRMKCQRPEWEKSQESPGLAKGGSLHVAPGINIPESMNVLATAIVVSEMDRSRVIRPVCDRDVLCVSDGQFNDHPGNALYREKVRVRQNAYAVAAHEDTRLLIVRSVANFVIKKNGGLFLRRCENGHDQHWVAVKFDDVVKSLNQAMCATNKSELEGVGN